MNPTYGNLHLNKPMRRMSLVDIAYETILEAIVDRRLLPGTRVNMELLAVELEMSNTPIREALARLTSTGLVEQISNRGFIVAPIISEEEYHQLFDVRYLIETQSLQRATFDSELLAQLQQIAQKQLDMDYGMTYRGFIPNLQADESFHLTLIRASNNRFYLDAWKSLNFYQHVSRLHTMSEAFEQNQHMTSLQEHVELVDLLEGGHLSDAIELLQQHIRRVEKRLLQPMKKLSQGANENS